MVNKEGRCDTNIVLRAFAAVRQGIKSFLQRRRINIVVEHLLTTAPLRTAQTLRKELENDSVILVHKLGIAGLIITLITRQQDLKLDSLLGHVCINKQ